MSSRSARVETFVDVSRPHRRTGKLARWRRRSSPSTSASATRRRRPSRSAQRSAARSRSSSSSATTRGASTTTSGWSETARSPAGPSRRACRSSPASSTSPSTSRTTRSSTATFEGEIPKGQYGGRHRRDLGQGHVRARRGEEERRPHGPAARRAAQGHLRARPREALGRPEELADPAQEGRLGARGAHGAQLPADARDPGGGRAARRLALRDQVGRLPDRGHGRRRRGRRSARARTRTTRSASKTSRRSSSRRLKTPDCVVDGEVCALDEDGRPSFSAMQQGKPRDADRLLRLRPARGRGRAARRPAHSRSGASGSRSSSTSGTGRSATRRPSTTATRCSRRRTSRASKGSWPSAWARSTSPGGAHASG